MKTAENTFSSCGASALSELLATVHTGSASVTAHILRVIACDRTDYAQITS